MDSNDLTPEQAAKIRDVLYPQYVYLQKLADRMRRRGFPFYDDLYVATARTRDSLSKVIVMLNRISKPMHRDTIGERAARDNGNHTTAVASGAFAAWAS